MRARTTSPNGEPGQGQGLTVDDVSIAYRHEADGRATYIEALRHVSLSVLPGQALGVLGETGSGKSSLGMAMMRLLPRTARLTGTITLNGIDLTAMSRDELDRVRGCEIGMIFQDPASALNPVRTIGAQIVDTARAHDRSLSKEAARQLAGDTLEGLGVRRERLWNYPHQLSGGMQQRALIATVMVANPKFLIADEPTASLDKVTEQQIVLLLQRLQAERQLGFVMISHDIGIVTALCQEVVVIYKGDVVEHGATEQVLTDPQHPYTAMLVRATKRERDSHGRLTVGSPVTAEVSS